ncbi:uncharacterized protein LOC117191613 [Drosophila miranda]|uniref:uncharacterized protein LOC117191613 n=1 Tax=Drosophila miranda TaxID=7229 RepID=UPI00143F423A|nr:uncharacterized protein LOC117191613 [Drosophila miranda]
MNPTINNHVPHSPARGVFSDHGFFVFTDQQQQQPGLQVPPEGSADKNGLNAMPFLGQIHTSPLLSRPMGPIGHAHPPPSLRWGIQMDSMLCHRWLRWDHRRVELPLDRRRFSGQRGDYYDDPHEEYSDCRYERQLLWRMANARGDETLVFFAVLMTTPWLFSLSLLGFILSLAALLRRPSSSCLFTAQRFASAANEYVL